MRYALICISLVIGGHLALAAAGTASTTFPVAGAFTGTDGAELYRDICRACHMPEGEGVRTGAGMFPALARNPDVIMPEYTAYVIMYGLRGMPSFEPDLGDAQIAAIANYVSQSFGNKSAGEIKPDAVQGMRPEKPVEYIDY